MRGLRTVLPGRRSRCPQGVGGFERAGAGAAPARGPAAALTATTPAAAAVLVCCLAACTVSGTGTRDEGPALARTTDRPLASSSPSAPAPGRVDAVQLVKTDPLVSPRVKRGLKPCPTDTYPVDVSYGKLTDEAANDVVVNVMTCDAVGVGSYVYRLEGDRFRNVFRNEETPVYAEIDRGDLVVTQKVYRNNDQLAYPSSEDVITYRWSASNDRFTEADRTHNDYSNPVGGDRTAPNADN